MGGVCHTCKGAHRLSLGTRRENDYLVVRIVVDGIDIDQCLGLDVYVTQSVCYVKDLDHRTSRKADVAAVFLGSRDYLLHPVDVR